MIFVTSWDDGHPLDERVAELLERFGLRGTFFIPSRNREHRPVIGSAALRDVDARFEIGSHTLDHTYLTRLESRACEAQIQRGKDSLEQLIGHRVNGFSYPGGKYSKRVARCVKKAGFRYARTAENLRFDIGGDLFAMPTTLQLYPHGQNVLLRNFIRYGNYGKRYTALRLVAHRHNYWDRLLQLVEVSMGTDRIVHLWGHSWEIDEQRLWRDLAKLLNAVAVLRPPVSTIAGVATAESTLADE